MFSLVVSVRKLVLSSKLVSIKRWSFHLVFLRVLEILFIRSSCSSDVSSSKVLRFCFSFSEVRFYSISVLSLEKIGVSYSQISRYEEVRIILRL